jgi:hypothetical protein
MSLDPFTTVRLLSLETFTTNWRMCICQWGGSAALTQHLATLQGIIYTSHARIFWDLLRRHVGREFLIYERRERQHLHSTNSRVGNARVAGFFPPFEGSICIQIERRAEDSVEDDGVAV